MIARGQVNIVDCVEPPDELQQLLSSYQRHVKPRIVLMKHDALSGILLIFQLLSLIRLIWNNTSLNLLPRCLDPFLIP